MSSISIPTPFSEFGLLYVTSGYVGDVNRPVYAIKPNAKGDITMAKGATTSEAVEWYLPQAGPYNPSPIIFNGIYYTLLDRGFKVYSINPRQLDRFRDRFSPAGAKDDSRDAETLSSSLRTDRRAFHQVSLAGPCHHPVARVVPHGR